MKPAIPILLLILLISPVAGLKADDRDSTKSGFDRFLERLYSNRKFIKNHPTLEFTYQPGSPSFPEGKLNSGLANTYTGDLVYGFTRFDDRLPMRDIFTYASEYVFLRNVNAQFKPDFWELKGISTDAWKFGGGLSTGYGYQLGNHKLILYHAGAFIWSRIDVDLLTVHNHQDIKIMERYDEDYRFGTYWSGGVKFQVSGPFYIRTGYEHTIVFPRHMFWKFTGSWLLENVSQRWIDFFEDDFMEVHGRNFPWVIFLIKNGISYAWYELRRHNMNWPFDTAKPLSYNSFQIGATFIF